MSHSHHHDFDSEDQYKSGFDISYIRRFLGYAAPQKLFIFLALFFLALSSATQLITPNIYRKSIDNYLVPLYTFISSDHEALEKYPKLKEVAIPAGDDTAAVPTSFLEKNKDISDSLKDKGENHYIFRKENYDGTHGFVYGDNWFVPDKEFADIDPTLLTKIRGTDITGLKRMFFLFLIVLALHAVADYFHRLTLEIASQRTMYALRMALFKHLQSLSVSLYNRTPIGKLVTRVTNDIEAINSMLSTVAVQMLASAGMFIGSLIIVLYINWKLTLISMTVLPFCVVITIIFRIVVRKVHRELRRILAKINGVLTEEFSGIKMIQSFNQQKRRREEFAEVNASYYKAGFKNVIYMGVFGPILDLIRHFGTALIILYGGICVLNGDLTLGSLMAFITYFGHLCNPLMQISNQITQLQSSLAASERIFTLLDTKNEVAQPEDPVIVPEPKGEVEFQNVDFSYIENEQVLKDVSFKIEPGKSIAIVGPTGAGKSSLINLVCRFYDANKGRVLLDGVDVKDWSNEELRKHISIVLQGTFVFSRSIYENIALGDPSITREKAIKAAETVCANQFIEKLPHGYDEVMAERGATLSAGEKQLLCFARALAHDPRILILDEATSNVDPATEHLIQDAIDKLMIGRTSMIVAHRLSTIHKVDEIFVLDDGKIIERGSHAELMARKGAYYDLYLLQFSRRI